jgi:peptidoglycan/xylan/chitin deacetylase (PgdA/CDA1 family)
MPPPAVTVLAYHRIATPDNGSLAPTLIDAYPSDFEAQMRYVAQRYNVISSWDLVRALREGATLPPRALVITFDDGYRCFQDTAFPVLRRLGLPVTLFVPTHYPGRPNALFWWDAIYRALMQTTAKEIEVARLGVLPLATPPQRHAAYERLVRLVERTPEHDAARLVDTIVERCAAGPNNMAAMLNWSEITDLAADGVNVGPHTQSHIVLAQATPQQVEAEVRGSWADLQERVPHALPIFCYPNGKPHAVNLTAARAVRQAGLAGAYTMVAGLNIIGRTNPYLLYRVGMVAGEPLWRFKLKLSLTGRLYRRAKALIRREQPEQFTFLP